MVTRSTHKNKDHSRLHLEFRFGFSWETYRQKNLYIRSMNTTFGTNIILKKIEFKTVFDTKSLSAGWRAGPFLSKFPVPGLVVPTLSVPGLSVLGIPIPMLP